LRWRFRGENDNVRGDWQRIRKLSTVSEHRFASEQAKDQPNSSENHCRKHISQKMCAQRDTAESHQKDQRYSAENTQQPPMPGFMRLFVTKKRASKNTADLTPVKRENTPIRAKMSS
jgi:hypothetical protein